MNGPSDGKDVIARDTFGSESDIILEARPDIKHGPYIGNCKWFNSKLGYGFLRICNTELKGTDIFVHHSGLAPLNSSFKTLYKGEYVHFDMIDGRNGKQAVNVTGICGGPLMCDNVTSSGYRSSGGGGYRGNGFGILPSPPPGLGLLRFSTR
jgi:cold shock CspA family protein